jgi:ribonuclease J
MKANRLIYLPLGGAGEIGMNAYVYGYGPEDKERLILVDLGVTFPDMDTTPGVDLIMPDMSWLEARKDRLEAIFITHAHEDHIGGAAHFWAKFKVPVYTRRFTGTIARLKFDEHSHPRDAVKIVEARPETVKAGPFDVQFVPVSHSIPESSALVIDCAAGRIVHSGDFKLDESPLVGEAWSRESFAAIAAERPVKALMCDSTNVFSRHAGRSESTLRQPLTEMIRAQRGMVVATTFASNVARLKTLAEAAQAADRSICLLGRAMRRMVSAAEESGVLKGFPRTISPEEANDVPRGNLMLIVTGSQGERRAASAQLSRGKYLGLQMKEGDTFLFSSKTIPGNERGVISIMNAYSEMGVNVVDDNDGLYHVSGHANRPDLEAVHQVLNPQIVIPMHGEHRHLREHAGIALAAGRMSEVVTNGMMIDLTGDAPQIAEYIETGRSYLDGSVMYGARDGIVRDRIRMALNGHVLATLILDEANEPLGDAWVELKGLAEKGRTGAPLADSLEAGLNEFLDGAGRKILSNDDKLEEAVRRLIRQISVEEIGKKPEVTIVISRLTEG